MVARPQSTPCKSPSLLHHYVCLVVCLKLFASTRRYAECAGENEWDDGADEKPWIEFKGCAGAAQAAPALFVGLAALVNHFLN